MSEHDIDWDWCSGIANQCQEEIETFYHDATNDNAVSLLRKAIYLSIQSRTAASHPALHNYPESLVYRNGQLEKSIVNHKAELKSLEDYNHRLRFDLNILTQLVKPDELTGNVVWRWQHDGYDYLRSMRNDQAVLISAEDLRDLLANGEKVAADNT